VVPAVSPRINGEFVRRAMVQITGQHFLVTGRLSSAPTAAIKANLVARGASTLLRRSFNDALWSHGWNNSRELVTDGIEQSTELSFGAFASSIDH
jgi:hypothetical protein